MTPLSLADVSVVRGGRRIVDNLSFTVEAGSLVALMGASGSGKTSILRAIAKLEPIDRGRIDTAGRVAMVFQFHHLFAHMRALQNVWLAPVHVLRQEPADAERRARELLDTVGVGHRADAYPHELSGGEAQRVAIARAIAVDPALLLMDEPTASLDAARREDLARTLRRLTAAGRTILVATHDREFADACADRVQQIDAGQASVLPSP